MLWCVNKQNSSSPCFLVCHWNPAALAVVCQCRWLLNAIGSYQSSFDKFSSSAESNFAAHIYRRLVRYCMCCCQTAGCRFVICIVVSSASETNAPKCITFRVGASCVALTCVHCNGNHYLVASKASETSATKYNTFSFGVSCCISMRSLQWKLLPSEQLHSRLSLGSIHKMRRPRIVDQEVNEPGRFDPQLIFLQLAPV